MSDSEPPNGDRLKVLSETDEQTREQTPDQGEEGAKSESSTSSDEDESPADPLATPAFPYSQELGQSIYVRPDIWADYQEMVDLRLTPELYDLGIKNFEKREVQDAMVRLAVENPDKIAQLIAEARKTENS